MRRIVDTATARLNIKMRITAEVDSLDAIKQMVQGGPERCVLPLGTFHRELKAGLLTGRRFDDNEMDALLVLAHTLAQARDKTGFRGPAAAWWRRKSAAASATGS